MVEHCKKTIIVKYSLRDALSKIESRLANQTEWNLLYQNIFKSQAELLYLPDIYSGAVFEWTGILKIFLNRARSGLVFIKLIEEEDETKITIITGGTGGHGQSPWVLDFGRHKRNIYKVLNALKKDDR